MEQDETEESIQALRNLVLLVGSLTTCGFIELKPGAAAVNGSLFKLPGFSVPQPTGRGQSHCHRSVIHCRRGQSHCRGSACLRLPAVVSHTAGAHASGYLQWSVTLPGRMRQANQMHFICICITVSCIVILTVELGLLVSILLAILLCTDASTVSGLAYIYKAGAVYYDFGQKCSGLCYFYASQSCFSLK